LREALRERWPEADQVDMRALRSVRAERWRGVPEETMDLLHERYRKRWTEVFEQGARSPDALGRVAEERIETLVRAMGPVEAGPANGGSE